MVTLNLPHDNLTSMIQIFYCFGLMGSYPIQMFPVFQILERAKAFENEMTKKLYFWHSALVAFGVSVGMVASTISLYELILWK